MKNPTAKRIVAPKHKQLCVINQAQPGPAGAQLVYQGGPLLANVDIISIYWGSAWTNDPLMPQLEAFFSFVVTSSLIPELGEYDVPGFTIGNGVKSGFVHITTDPPSIVDDSAIQVTLQNLIANGTVKPSTANTLYCFMFPAGVTVTLQGSSSCTDFCGYHNDIGSDQFGGPFYAVLPYQSCSGCLGIAGDVLDSSTVVMWHEIAEAITDPIPGAGWYDNTYGEIGDICEGGNKPINQSKLPATGIAYTSPGPVTDANGVITIVLTPTVAPPSPPPPPPPPPPGTTYIVQLLWSNNQGRCI